MTAALLLLITLPILGSAACATQPRPTARWLGFAIACGVLATVGVLVPLNLESFQSGALAPDGSTLALRLPWLPSAGIALHLALDGIALPFVAVIAFVTPWLVLAAVRSAASLLALEGLALACVLGIEPLAFVLVATLLVTAVHAGAAIARPGVVGPCLAAVPLAGLAVAFVALLAGDASWTFGCVTAGIVGIATLALVPSASGVGVFVSAVLLYGLLRFLLPAFPVEVMADRARLLLLAAPFLGIGAVTALLARDRAQVLFAWNVTMLGYMLLGALTVDSGGMQAALIVMLAHGLLAAALRIQIRSEPATCRLDTALAVATAVLALAVPIACIKVPGALDAARELAPWTTRLALLAMLAVVASALRNRRSADGIRAVTPSPPAPLVRRLACVALLLPALLLLVPSGAALRLTTPALGVMEKRIFDAYRDHILEPVERARSRTTGQR